jgi:hypothetical protein
LVTDLPADFEVFGQAVDSSMADLLGGTTGQILAKNSNTNMDFVWITNDVGDITAVTAGTGISGGGTSGSVTITNSMATEIAAKGDLIVGTGSQTFDNLTAGSNGTPLIADSSTTTGLKWGYAYDLGVNIANSADQSINNTTTTVLSQNTEFWDSSGFHSTVTNNSRITIPAGLAGRYALTGFVVFPANSTGSRYVGIRKNNGSDDFISSSPGVATYSTYVNFNVIYEAGVGDYFEMICFQNSGGALNALAISRFQMTYLGA